MEVYIELIYIVNIAILMMCFQMLTILLNIQLSYKKTLLYSVLTNYSVVMLYVDNMQYLLLTGWCITFICLFKKQVFLYYPIFVFIYYSSMYFIQSLITEAFIYQGIIITPTSYTTILLGIVAILFVVLQVMFIVYSKRKVSITQYQFSLTITYKNKEYTCLGFLDSGNEVYYLGFPLLLINKNKIVQYEVEDIITVDNIQDIMVDIIRVEKVVINKQELRNVYVGMIENIKYDCLVHKQLMGGVI